MSAVRSYRDVAIPAATIARIANEPHMARVREARRAAGLWLTAGVPVRPVPASSSTEGVGR